MSLSLHFTYNEFKVHQKDAEKAHYNFIGPILELIEIDVILGQSWNSSNVGSSCVQCRNFINRYN